MPGSNPSLKEMKCSRCHSNPHLAFNPVLWLFFPFFFFFGSPLSYLYPSAISFLLFLLFFFHFLSLIEMKAKNERKHDTLSEGPQLRWCSGAQVRLREESHSSTNFWLSASIDKLFSNLMEV